MASEYHRGEMDIQEQTATYQMFGGLTKWGSLIVAAGLLHLTVWFCTPAGFMGASIATAVVVAIGIAVLRDKPTGDH